MSVRILRLALAIALLSAAALAYQLLLMHWLAIAHWHAFAAMIISLALLGHGASGSLLSLCRDWARTRFDMLFPACALLFASSAVLALWLARAIPFNGLELAWNPRQLLWLGALYLVLALPFLFAAAGFGLAFARHGRSIPALYGADLAGAGLGALAAIALQFLPVEHGLLLAAAAGPLAAALAMPSRRARWVAVLLAAVPILLLPLRPLAPAANEYKGLSRALLLPEARILAERHSPYGRLTVIESPRVPLRHAPGLSLLHTGEPPPQLGLFTDGDGLSPITRRDPDAGDTQWLAHMLSALPHRLQRPSSVLVLGAGGGLEVLQALALGAARVDAVELDPQRLALVRETFDDFAGGLYRDPRVRPHAADPRTYARASEAHYDLIVLAGGESFAAAGAGARAAAEQYGLTVEALRDYHARLAPEGLLAIARWSKQPPRDELKLFAAALAALRAEGMADPGTRLALIHHWDTSLLLLRRAPFDSDTAARLQALATDLGFDTAHLPNVDTAGDAPFHDDDQAWLHDGTRALLSPQADRWLRDYKFALAPATDDRPYFGDFFRWRSLPELWRLREEGSAVLLDSATLVLIGALLQALPLSLLLILLPLLALPRSADTASAAFSRTRAGGYFLALGLGFMLIEIATLSRLTLLVGHPLLAAAVGLGGFLLFAGAGSLTAQRLLARTTDATREAGLAHGARWAVLAIGLGLAWQLATFALGHHHGAGWPVSARALLGLLGIAPLAFAMGMPFPLGLARLAHTAPAFVPWAWGINGCASVLAAIGAVLLSMAIGLRATLLLALGLYALAAWLWRPSPSNAADAPGSA